MMYQMSIDNSDIINAMHTSPATRTSNFEQRKCFEKPDLMLYDSLIYGNLKFNS